MVGRGMGRVELRQAQFSSCTVPSVGSYLKLKIWHKLIVCQCCNVIAVARDVVSSRIGQVGPRSTYGLTRKKTGPGLQREGIGKHFAMFLFLLD